MAELTRKKYIVTVRQGKIKPKGGIEGWLDRNYTIYAKTTRSAKSAIKDAGIRGRIIDVQLGDKT